MEGEDTMIVFPAMDIKEAQVVRLYQGDYNQKTVYSKQPEEMAKKLQEEGAQYLHVVDLDGAKQGTGVNLDRIKKIREALTIPIQLGGGIREEETVKQYLEKIQIDRVILGTIALTDPNFVKKMIDRYGKEKIVVGIDVKEEKVMVQGWTKEISVDYLSLIQQLEQIGVKYMVVTDITKDGTLIGPNFKMYQEIQSRSKVKVMVSGGIRNHQDLEQLAKLQYYGCIVGKAYYEGKVSLRGKQNA